MKKKHYDAMSCEGQIKICTADTIPFLLHWDFCQGGISMPVSCMLSSNHQLLHWGELRVYRNMPFLLPCLTSITADIAKRKSKYNTTPYTMLKGVV